MTDRDVDRKKGVE